MPNPTTETAVEFTGPAGLLEGKLAIPTQDDATHNAATSAASTHQHVAIVCHPHPLYGGSMDNKVAYTLSRAALDCQMPALRFNFRGVGNSAGEYAHGIGETDDALAALAFLQAQYPNAKPVILGFSFGGGVAIRTALDQAATPAALVTVAPSLMVFAEHPPQQAPNCLWLTAHSRDDDTVSYAKTMQWAESLDQPPVMHSYDDCGHFFHGQLTPLRRLVSDFLQASL